MMRGYLAATRKTMMVGRGDVGGRCREDGKRDVKRKWPCMARVGRGYGGVGGTRTQREMEMEMQMDGCKE